MKTFTIVIASIFVLFLLSVIGVFVVAPIIIKNSLVAKDEAVKAAWAQIDTQLIRRTDLIPNLVNTVKGYAKHEKDVITAVSEARSQLLAAKGPEAKAGASKALSSNLIKLLAVAEKYPNLKADAAFIRLQDELAGTENRIAVARTRYNNTVNEFNASIRKFPGSLFVKEMELKAAEYFKAPESKNVEKVPEVKF